MRSPDSARRREWPVRIFRLGDEPPDDLSSTTAEERIAMVAELSARMWELTGRPLPSYTRATMPVRIVPLA
jgi:hypothetical protein